MFIIGVHDLVILKLGQGQALDMFSTVEASRVSHMGDNRILELGTCPKGIKYYNIETIKTLKTCNLHKMTIQASN